VPKVKRTDAIQAFTSQETPIVALIRDHMAPWLLGLDPAMVEEL
jgi:hypothetical protein